ncbi:MAG: hypothetical protein CSA81_07130 [Acidobacteria bacterium]|nr:MAG: hypothetical protein CSA81_07130 [Acidobacteriota bacterium]PIE89473.1 MAG: hypothetical protein CR997_10920 [Acidobacteriota bacterium]
MKKTLLFLGLVILSMQASAGLRFGLQAGAMSPTKGFESNERSLALGADLWFKLPFMGVKVEGFYLDSDGDIEERFNDEVLVEGRLNINSMFAADAMFYPMGGLFYLQAGVNLIDVDVQDIDRDVIDNKLGVEVGAGVNLLDKLFVQGKILYTPNALEEDAVDTLTGLDDKDMVGYLVSIGWHF